MHTGEIEATGEGVGGIAIHVAARVTALARAGEVLASSTVRDLVAGSALCFRDCGSRTMKGLPDSLHIFAVERGGKP